MLEITLCSLGIILLVIIFRIILLVIISRKEPSIKGGGEVYCEKRKIIKRHSHNINI